MKDKTLVIILSLVAIIGGWLLLKGSSNSETATTAKELIPISAISHGHGLAVDLNDPNKVYIATHYGLILFDGGIVYKFKKII